MRKIGIIGYGKMGKDIFNCFLNLPECFYIKVFCRHDSDVHAEKVKKELSKLLRRKRISEEQYNLKSENITFTDSLCTFKDCDFIIESISEDCSAKNQLFRQLDEIVTPECILTTNTSSLAVSDIFDGVSNKARCLGLHFFYPVRFTSFAEINRLSETGTEQLETAVSVLEKINKKPVVFSDCYQTYINQIITAAISYGIQLQQTHNIGAVQFTEIMKELFEVHGLFGLIDGIGLNLLIKGKMIFGCPRLQHIIKYGNDKMGEWLESGISGEPNSFFKSLPDESERIVSDSEKNEIISDMTSFLREEVSIASCEYGGEPLILANAVQDILGLPESFFA